jgi:hypothetical protein
MDERSYCQAIHITSEETALARPQNRSGRLGYEKCLARDRLRIPNHPTRSSRLHTDYVIPAQMVFHTHCLKYKESLRTRNQPSTSDGALVTFVLTKCQRQFSNKGCNEVSSESDKIRSQAWKNVVEIVRISSETCESPGAEDAMWEDAEHVRIVGVQVDGLFKAQRKVISEVLPPDPLSGPI